MRLILIPPFQNPGENWGWAMRELVAQYQKTGHFQGVEIDVDEGEPGELPSESSEEAAVNVSPGIVAKVRAYAEMGAYDGIVLTGCLGDPGFLAGRSFSKIPVAAAVYSSFLVGSLIGERFTYMHCRDGGSLSVRRYAQMCGFGHKLVSVRACGHSPREMYRALVQYRDQKGDRARAPELKTIIDDIAAQAMAAIQKEKADSVILGVEPINVLEDEIRAQLDEAGYGEIAIIGYVAAALEMAKTLVSMKLVKSTRAHPNFSTLSARSIKAKPEYR